MSLPKFAREQVVDGMQVRRERGESPEEIVAWLATLSGFAPTTGEAIGLLEEVCGLTPDQAEDALRSQESWAKLLELMDP